MAHCGPLEKRLTHQPFTLALTGSNPVRVIGTFSSAGRASALQAEGRRFDPVNVHAARWRSGLTHQPFTLAFTGSNPVRVIGAVVQLVRMPACHAGGRGFEPHLRRFTCRNGGIGRRTGLKIQRRRLRVGSTPTFGIKRL